jgi:hypothetical protein
VGLLVADDREDAGRIFVTGRSTPSNVSQQDVKWMVQAVN